MNSELEIRLVENKDDVLVMHLEVDVLAILSSSTEGARRVDDCFMVIILAVQRNLPISGFLERLTTSGNAVVDSWRVLRDVCEVCVGEDLAVAFDRVVGLAGVVFAAD